MPQRALFSGSSTTDGWSGSRRKVSESDLDITPMIDCVFLLLIFFMVTSTMRANPDANVPTAQHGVGVDSRGTLLVRIEGGDGEPVIRLDGRESAVDEVQEYVRTGFQNGLSLVVIKADREVPHGFVQQVSKEVDAVEGVKFSIGVQDKKKR